MKGDEDEGNDKDENENELFKQRYKGHCNIRTIKEVNFFGPNSDYVVSGSDDGRIFIWIRKLVNLLRGDHHVVKCASGHPFDMVLATSGIENNVKVWHL